jgi:hypothetical protein
VSDTPLLEHAIAVGLRVFHGLPEDHDFEQTFLDMDPSAAKMRDSLAAALRAVPDDAEAVRQLAVHRMRQGAAALPWKSWKEVPQTVRDRYEISSRLDLKMVFDPPPRADA